MKIIISPKLDRVAFAIACDVLRLERLCDQDFAFLSEYARIIKPIADAIGHLEGNVLFGNYLPILFTCRVSLKEMELMETLMYCGPLLTAVKNGFDKRFRKLMRLGDIFERPDAKAVPLFLGMLTNPEFKMKCIPDTWFHENANGIVQIKSILLNAMKQMIQVEKNESSNPSVPPTQSKPRGKSLWQLVFF